MNLRDATDYIVGLDIGTGSVGWAVVDKDGDLYKFKGKNTWGSRLFDSANTAADTRMKRTLRRRYARRHKRIMTLRELILSDVMKVDPDFFCRMNQSDLIPADRDYDAKHPFFNGEPFTEQEYYERFPTIYHLREYLVHSKEKEDIRLIYLALHHMMKYRGNFLVDGDVSAADADSSSAIAGLLDEVQAFCDLREIDFNKDSVDLNRMVKALEDSFEGRRSRQEEFSAALSFPASEKKIAKALGDAVFGYQVNYGFLFKIEESSDSKFSLDNDEKVEKFENELLPEEYIELFSSLRIAYNAYLLAGLLSDAAGGTISSAMRCRYEQHKIDLSRTKAIVRSCNPTDENGTCSAFNAIFRGSKYADGTYKKESAKGYTGYILGKVSREEFYKQLVKVVDPEQLSVQDREFWNDALVRMDKGTFLQKQRISENGAIPHQLHLEEMRAIIRNQKAFYPTLEENGEKICSLLEFRLPYYVGPLGKQGNPRRSKPFAWAKRNPGMENERVYPWNFEQVIDTDACAEAFITNLIGECSYYLGKKVIPKHSLLYSEFCVRQELNVCKHDYDGENFSRFDNETIQAIFEDVFKKHRKVKVETVEEYLKGRFGSHYKIKGTQKENEFASSLGSYIDFARILGHPIESFEDYAMVETLITWITVFEDKKILKRKVTREYGPVDKGGNGALTNDQVKSVCKLRYTGWSKLSREFLEELRVDFQGQYVSIMNILRDSRDRHAMNLMEILADDRFDFKKELDKRNQEFLREQSGYLLEDIPGSPALKRGINQTLKIVEEIVSIAGKPPAKICIEMAREEVGKGKGSRTKSRAKQLDELYAAISKDLSIYEGQAALKKELSKCKDALDDERLYLYFLQRGKCAYSGRTLNIEDLSLYQVDHIVPQSMVKDDSLDNKVLVFAYENQKKLDQYPLPKEMRSSRNYHFWASLHDAKLMSDKKFNALTESRISNRKAMGFINRQLVETRQVSKHVVNLLQSMYPDTVIETVKAELTHDLRNQYGFYKVREINDWHHAHDAYLACQISRFVKERYPRISEDFDYATFSRYTMATKKSSRGKSGLIANSFGVNGFDAETGEVFRDAWYGDREVERIRKCLNYKDCFVSRKVEKLTGEFWNQTVYSPRIKSDKAIPLKAGKSVEHYGHYKSPNSAYYCVIEHFSVVRRKRKPVVSVIGIPVNVSYRIKSDDDLLAYLQYRYEEPRILRSQVLKYQKIEWAGAEYYLTSPIEMINAQQLWLPECYRKLLWTLQSKKRMEKKDHIELECELDSLFSHLCKAIASRYPRYEGLYKKLIDSKCQKRYLDSTFEDKQVIVQELLSLLHCNASIGLRSLGLSNSAGRMNEINYGGSIASITFVDTSVTGMFERRWIIEP